MSLEQIDALFGDGILRKFSRQLAEMLGMVGETHCEVAILVMPRGRPDLVRVGMNVDHFALVELLEAALKVAKGGES